MTIDQIKEKLSIKDVLANYGITINKNQHINCPFHDDKTPSMKVYEETNTVYCFSGNCKTHDSSLDVIEFVMQKESCTKRQAILKCKSMLNYEVPVKTEVRPIDQIWKALKRSLSSHVKAKKYLKSRGLSTSNIGYHSGQLSKSKLVEEAKLVGLITGENKAWASNCIIYPLLNNLGQLVSFYGRSLTVGHFYLSGRCGLYPSYPSKNAKRIIITESIIDAASLLEIKALKDYEILALYGTNGFTGAHKKALECCGDLEEIILLLDGDEAGQKASEKYQTELKKLLPKVNTKIVELPKNTDVNELWANHLSEGMFVELLEIEVQAAPKNLENKLNTANKNNLIYRGMHALYSVKGFSSLKNLDSLKITLVTQLEHKKYRGKVELYEDTAVQKYCRAASEKLGIKEDLLDLDISLLTDELEIYRAAFEELEDLGSNTVKNFQITSEARKEAKSFLSEKDLFIKLNKLVGKTGIVGEESTRLLLLIVASSYKCKNPLHALIQGSTGMGKTLLMRKVMDMIPEGKSHIWTRITDKSLYHAGRQYEHTSTAIEDWDGLSEEVQYVFREFQSGHILRSSTTEKLPDGRMSSKEIIAYGPISSLICTTQGAIYEDNMSRCFLTAIDESKEQSEKIVHYQNKKMRGEIDSKSEDKATHLIQNMIHVLEPLEVVNPYAGQVYLPQEVHKIRRLNQLYLVFVQQVAWWHQLQRTRDEQGRIIATLEDLQMACNLLFETIVLKVDELDGSLRQFFERLKEYLSNQDQEIFGRREIRQGLKVSKSSVQRYLKDLEDLEYVRLVNVNKYQGFQYKIVFWDDYQALRSKLKSHLSEQISKLSDPNRPKE
jgi:DNA primase